MKTRRQTHRQVDTMTPETFRPLNRYFDKVYVLSLPHATARQDNIAKVLEGLMMARLSMPFKVKMKRRM